jgi:hypothetical protein
MKPQEPSADVVERIRGLDAGGASDDDVAAWLMGRGLDFGSSVYALVRARSIDWLQAHFALDATAAWRSRRRQFHLKFENGDALGEFESVSLRPYAAGERLNMPHAPEPPHEPELGRGTVWRIASVEPDEDPNFEASLVVTPVARLEVLERDDV